MWDAPQMPALQAPWRVQPESQIDGFNEAGLSDVQYPAAPWHVHYSQLPGTPVSKASLPVEANGQGHNTSFSRSTSPTADSRGVSPSAATQSGIVRTFERANFDRSAVTTSGPLPS